MIALGTKPKEIKMILGHRSAAFTLTVYGHVFGIDLDALADRLDGLGSAPCQSDGPCPRLCTSSAAATDTQLDTHDTQFP